jgi:predicted  nucleic acid-binding Zn-ribbon protein
MRLVKGLLLLTREELAQLSEEELEKLYEMKKTEFEKTVAKNRRIQAILSRKIQNKTEIVNNLQREVDELLAIHPELNVAKSPIDDANYDPEKLQNEIDLHKETLINMQTNQVKIQREISELETHLERQKTVEIQLHKEIEDLIAHRNSISGDNAGQAELLELSKLAQEYQALQDELNKLAIEINSLKNQIQR